MRIYISPSMLSADFAHLFDSLKHIEKGGADFIHWDVMDGHFVDNLSFGAPIIKALRPHTNLPFDVHLMIEDPAPYIATYVDAGADYLTVHAEAAPHLDETLREIRARGVKAGVALSPATPPSVLEYVLDKLDLILVMSVNPGFGGQSFIESQLTKIAVIAKMIEGRDIRLSVDGGINETTAPAVREAGADTLVSGSYLFSQKDEAQLFKRMQGLRGL